MQIWMKIQLWYEPRWTKYVLEVHLFGIHSLIWFGLFSPKKNAIFYDKSEMTSIVWHFVIDLNMCAFNIIFDIFNIFYCIFCPFQIGDLHSAWSIIVHRLDKKLFINFIFNLGRHRVVFECTNGMYKCNLISNFKSLSHFTQSNSF